MAARIITPEDLLEFKQELFQELQKLFAAQNSNTLQKKWLKSPEVRELLGISPGTLQNLRVNGTLPFTKVGGMVYYQSDDILKMLEENRSQAGGKQ